MKVSPWVSRLALADMQALSGEGCWWLQVAPQGRGQDLWPPELSARGISIVRGRTKAEGLYIQLAPDSGLPLPELTEALDEAATGIRLRTRCCEMAKRGNRSRIQIKCAPFLVAPSGIVPAPATMGTRWGVQEGPRGQEGPRRPQ